MMILIAIISLGAIGVVGALLLFWASKTLVSDKFSLSFPEPIVVDVVMLVVLALLELV